MTPPLSLSELETQPAPPPLTYFRSWVHPPPHFCSLPWEPLQGAVSGCSEQSPQTLSTNSQPGFTPEPTPRASSSPPTALAVGAVPVVLGALGFTGAGIAASSLAAKMMSAAAVANGGGVAAGSLVATLQSVGAAGLSTSSNILLGSVGSAFGAWLGGTKKVPPSPPPAEPRAEGGQPGEDVSQAEPPNPPHKSEKLEK